MPERPDPLTNHPSTTVVLDDQIPLGHPVRYVAVFVAELSASDWAALGVTPAKTRGAPRTAPELLVRLWLSGFVLGIRSARGLERGCRERFDLYWACGGQVPDHNTLWHFYRDHRSGMRQLLRITIETALALGLVDLAVQAVDGTKIVANADAAKHLDEAQLTALAQATEQAIADLEAQHVGEDPPPPNAPSELHDARVLQQRLRQARQSLQTDHPRPVNRTDPEAHWMKTRTGRQLGYNGQLVVAATDPQVGQGPGRLILAATVRLQANDEQLLAPMGQTATDLTGGSATATTLVADAGYGSRASRRAAAALGFRIVVPALSTTMPVGPYTRDQFTYDPDADTFTCPQNMVLHRAEQGRNGRGQPGQRYRGDPARCRACPAFGDCTTSHADGRTLWVTSGDEIETAHASWMATTEAKRLSRQRRGLIEPVIGILKEQLRARRTAVRGRAKVEAEWVLTAVAFNLRTLARAVAPLSD